MRAPLSWLREYVTVDAPADEIARRLSISSLEVERVIYVGVADVDGNLGRFLVGRVIAVEPHPNADRLRVCHVDVGEGEARQIVCGAWNFEAGATVAVALPGARLPILDVPLDERELRGQHSRGMILAEDEIGLGDDHAGIMVLAEGPEPGTPLVDVLPIHDRVLDVTPTINRVDLLSMVGLAREVSALFDGDFHPPAADDPAIVDREDVDVTVEDFGGCPRYIGRVFRDVSIGPSPQWLRSRLFLAEMRSISNVVDVTNYAMHVWGSPLHAFDRTRLAGARVVVRRARPGEELRTLDGTLRRLTTDDLMITDGERSVALAAIMGGEESEVTAETNEVLLEAANFEPLGILRSSERLALRTAGSNRWEKGVDPYLAEPAAVLASRMIVDLAGARMTGHVDVQSGLPERPVVRLRTDRASRLIGLVVAPDEQRSLLERLEFEVSPEWDVTVPTWRARDVTREVDVIEEVARVVLDRVPHTMPLRRHVRGRLSKDQRLRRLVEDVLVGAGLSEAYTWSLAASDPDSRAIRLPDPMTSDQAILRTTLFPGLIEAARTGLDAGAVDIALFEIARVYLPSDEQLPDEHWRVAGVVAGGYEAVKGVLEVLYAALQLDLRVERGQHSLLHPGKSATTEAGWLGELHPTLLDGVWGAFELDLTTLFAPVPERVVYEDVLTFPAVLQDIAVTVDEDVEAGALVDAAREAAGPLLREARVFDVYRGEQVGHGRKSVAIHLAFQSPERTLTEEEATAFRDEIVALLVERFGAELRA
ncbi:MAG: phenylalanine--tRNA ligase subunit beta [Thermoleophilia bacterium]|nr:phenylalanine--tRNA ligase subunit beta [Thermoleophilia bacterium]MDH4339134.1 phenylalanine--tRNA ligase subunit beta [Thermoleophilia bacterium]